MLARVATTAEIVMPFLPDTGPLLFLPIFMAASPLGCAFDFERFLPLDFITDRLIKLHGLCATFFANYVILKWESLASNLNNSRQLHHLSLGFFKQRPRFFPV